MLILTKENPRAWYAFFEDEDADTGKERRKLFYQKLSAFSKHMELAMGSYSLYSSIGFEQMQIYKKDLLFFSKAYELH
jgi:type I restriction enzyme R subunit